MGSNLRPCRTVRCAVVGHVEWVESVLVDRVPGAGEIAHGAEDWSEPAGGGGVAAAQLLKLAGACDFFTALGDDERGRRAGGRVCGPRVPARGGGVGSAPPGVRAGRR